MGFIEVSSLTKSYPVGGFHSPSSAVSISRWKRERWSPLSGRRAWGRARCSTSSAASTRWMAAASGSTIRTWRRSRTAVSWRSGTGTWASSSSSTTCFPEFTAVENAEMPMRIARCPASERRARATALLQSVGLGERLLHRPGMLSGGEQQRVAIARALIMEPSLLLADEPTGDLDEHTADALHLLLRGMTRERALTSVIATHNPRLAAACDRVLRLEEGRLRAA